MILCAMDIKNIEFLIEIIAIKLSICLVKLIFTINYYSTDLYWNRKRILNHNLSSGQVITNKDNSYLLPREVIWLKASPENNSKM